MTNRLDDLLVEAQGLVKEYQQSPDPDPPRATLVALLREAKETIRQAVRDEFERMGHTRGIPYGYKDDADSCPMACKLDMPVDGGESFTTPIRLFVMAFDEGIFPEYDALEIDDPDLYYDHVYEQVCDRGAAYSTEESWR